MTRSDAPQQPGPTFAPQGPAAYSSPGGAPAPSPGAGPTPDPRRRSWFARHKVLTALLVLVVLVAVGGALGGGDGDDPSTGASPTAPVEAPEPAAAEDDAAPAAAPAEDAAPAEQLPGIGDAVRDGKFEFTVTQVETGVSEVGDEYLSEQAQGQFVLVHMTVANIGDRAQMLDGSNQTLLDTEGREHSASSTAAIYLDGSDTFLNDINPGNVVEGIVVFDIPADAVPASIELHDSMFSGGVTVSLGQ